MPQIFQVLRCYKCFVFQVHQTKKSNKWECKLCGEKQSVKRHYGIGTAKDCRLHVQKLNIIRGEIDEQKETPQFDSDEETEEVPLQRNQVIPIIKKSKWSEYVEKPGEVEEPEANVAENIKDCEVVLEVRKKRKKNNFKCPILINDNPCFEVKNSISNNTLAQATHPKPELPLSKSQCVPYISEPLLDNKENLNNCVFAEPKNEMKRSLETSKTTEYVRLHFVPPVVKSNSKWAQFVENKESDDVNEDYTVEMTDALEQTNSPILPYSQDLFSLCNDDELDTVLDI